MIDLEEPATAPTIEEKTAAPPEQRDNVARCSLARLRFRLWPVTPINGFKSPPDRLEFQVMDRREVWIRCDDGTKGETTNYELQR